MIVGGTALPLTFSAMYTAALLFAPTTILLAAVSPFIAKFLLTALNSYAKTIGNINAIGTIGSIAGAVATGSLLIPLFGLGEIFLGIAVVLLLLSVLVSGARLPLKATGVFLALIIAHSALSFSSPVVHGSAVLADVSTPYNRIWVFDFPYHGETLRALMTDPFGIQCGMPITEEGEVEEGRVVFSYLQAFEALARERLKQDEPIRALFLGGCNYSYPRSFLKEFPHASATVVELDPDMTKVAKEYFALSLPDYPQLRVVHQDARVFINENTDTYDVIFFDIFGSSTNIPHHVLTKEALLGIQDRLSEDGFVVMNIIAPLGGPASRFTASVMNTLEAVFPESVLYQFESLNVFNPQNLVMAATSGEAFPRALPHTTDASLSLFPADRSFLEEGLVLTDNYAPVEYLTQEIRARVF